MKYRLTQIRFLVAIFLILALLPALVGLIGPLPAGRGFWIEFVWITVGSSPFSMQQHPFSIASSPSDPPLELTSSGN